MTAKDALMPGSAAVRGGGCPAPRPGSCYSVVSAITNLSVLYVYVCVYVCAYRHALFCASERDNGPATCLQGSLCSACVAGGQESVMKWNELVTYPVASECVCPSSQPIQGSVGHRKLYLSC